MADAKGIRRLVQLVLDKASAARLKKDMGDALDRGTDPTKAKRNLGAVEAGLGRLKTAALAMAAAIAAALAFKKLWNFAKDAVRTAADADAIWSRLAQSVTNTGISWDSVAQRVHNIANAFQRVSTVGDEEFAQTLQRLISITGDFEGSLRNVSLVANMAIMTGRDMETMAQVVGRAMLGDTTLLKRYGIVVREGTDAIEAMREASKNYAENEAKTFHGRIQQLTNDWEDFKQALGEAITESETAAGAVHRLDLVVRSMTKWVNENRDSIQGMGEALLAVAKVLALIAVPFMQVFAGWSKLIGVLNLQIAKFYSWVGGLADVVGMKDLAQSLRDTYREIDASGRSFRETGDAIEAAAQALASFAVSQSKAAGPTHEMIDILHKQRDAASQAGAAIKGIGTPTAGPHPKTQPSVPAITAKPLTLSLRTRIFDIQSAEMQKIAEQRAQEMMSVMTSAAYTIEDAWAGAFQSAAEGMTNLGQLAGSVGWAIAAGLANGLAMLYEGKAAAAIAEGIMGNAAGFAAAIKFTAAAAIFRALQGIAGSHARGGGGGPSAYAGTTASGAPNIGGSPATEINIYVDPMDPDNPLHQRVVKRTIDQATQRYGNQTPTKVTVHSGSRP